MFNYFNKTSFAIVSPCRASRNYTLLGTQFNFSEKTPEYSFCINVCKWPQQSLDMNESGSKKYQRVTAVSSEGTFTTRLNQ